LPQGLHALLFSNSFVLSHSSEALRQLSTILINPETIERVMEKNQIRRLPVVDHDNRIVGIVSLDDLAIKGDETRAGVTLERVSEHSGWVFSTPRR
jgi:predicted transcriptional regulator